MKDNNGSFNKERESLLKEVSLDELVRFFLIHYKLSKYETLRLLLEKYKVVRR